MIDAKYAELINRDIDGVITPSEQADLRQYLAGSTEARTYYNELVQVTAKLHAVKSVSPPVSLKQSVMAQISRERYWAQAEGPRHESYLSRLTQWFVPSPAAWLTSGAFAGALIMLLALNIFHEGKTQMGGTGGTMLPIDGNEPQTIDRQVLTVGDASVTVETKRLGDDVMMVVAQTDSPVQVAVSLTYDQRDLRLSGFEDNYGGTVDFQKAGSSVSFTCAGGQVVRVVFHNLTDENSPLQVSFSQGGVGHTREFLTEIK